MFNQKVQILDTIHVFYPTLSVTAGHNNDGWKVGEEDSDGCTKRRSVSSPGESLAIP